VSKEVSGYALRLRGIRVHGHMGVSDGERERPQELIVAVDVELANEIYPARDDLARAADYAEVVRATHECAQARHYRLLETFALQVARRLEDRWPLTRKVRVAVTKARVPLEPAPDEATVEVTLKEAFT
jgi:dihydroneopterin aldolase